HFEVGGTGHAQHDDAFALGEPEFGQAFSGGADVVLQTALEQVPVAALEHDLPELQEHTQLAQLLRGCPDRAVRTRVDGGGVERGGHGNTSGGCESDGISAEKTAYLPVSTRDASVLFSSRGHDRGSQHSPLGAARNPTGI